MQPLKLTPRREQQLDTLWKALKLLFQTWVAITLIAITITPEQLLFQLPTPLLVLWPLPAWAAMGIAALASYADSKTSSTDSTNREPKSSDPQPRIS